MVHTESTIEPNEEAHEEYMFYMDCYIETYEQMKESMHKMSRHEASSEKAPVA